ncbi:MAPEG family protein [Coralloluteibacterium stylophorae]|uniref:MAPEG family protein n=1 Tax=Coralloluteibacterium stylophorae TaxID=1776034 RepID=A0A8J7VUG3_9GAMM|nr:MAPEG family protein [Coralloluteibacterium stylophorae]MBS7456498.1 MAPEG family protein [Coralloluteibacterium stylophorae]
MAAELVILAWAVVLGFAHVLLAAAAATAQRGIAWNASARDAEVPPLAGVAARLARASGNFRETFPFFAALVLIVVVAGRQDATSTLGAQLYLGARLVYLPLYALGVPWVRSLVWVASVLGIALVGAALP